VSVGDSKDMKISEEYSKSNLTYPERVSSWAFQIGGE